MRIGIIGAKGHGKDSIADILIDENGFRKVAFADPMKEMLHVGLGISRKILYGPADVKERVLPEFGVSPRHMLVTLGTEWGRRLIHEDLWTNIAMLRTLPLYELEHGVQSWVASDVRFINEAKALVEAGFVMFKVERPGYVTKTGEHAGHQSETELNDIEYDVLIRNDSTLEDLHEKARRILKAMRHANP